MVLQDLFNQLARTELTNLPMADQGVIATASHATLTDYTNEALLKLYTRFNLKENDVVIELHDHITFYHLLPRFSLNYKPTGASDNEPIRYILDLPDEPFNDELVRILSVRDHCGNELPLNDRNQPFSVFTPQAKQLQVPNTCSSHFLSVSYQQKHTPLNGDLSATVEIPDVLLPGLKSYIAHKVFSHMNSPLSNVKAPEFLDSFEAVCNEVQGLDLVASSTVSSNTRFECGGWV